MATAVDAARTVSPFRAAYTEAAVADFVFERCANEVDVEIGKRRLGDVGMTTLRIMTNVFRYSGRLLNSSQAM